jgi:hypothetical protein
MSKKQFHQQIDVTGASVGIERSIINLVVDPKGILTFYLLGKLDHRVLHNTPLSTFDRRELYLFNSTQRRKKDNALVAANSIEYFLCDLCAFAVNKNLVIARSKFLCHDCYLSQFGRSFIQALTVSNNWSFKFLTI